MAITRENRFYKMEVLDDGTLQVVNRETFLENGRVISVGGISRKVVAPGDVVAESEDDIVKTTAASVHTPARVAAYQAKAAARRASRGNPNA